MGATAPKAYPTPGAIGAGLGTQAVAMAQAQPNVQPLQPTGAARPLKPLTADQGQVLQPGQPAIPFGQTPRNPWGQNRGGSGLLPLYRRPGTMPEY